MVSHFVGKQTPDNFLTVEGVRKGFFIAPEEGGGLNVAPSFLDELIDAQQTEDFSYRSVPPTVLTMVEMPRWDLGAGFVNAPTGALSYRGYSHSRGVDVSDGERARRSAKPASLDGVEGAVTRFYHSPFFGWYALAGRRVYRWSLSGQAWVEVYDTGSDVILATDILEFTNSVDDYLFLAFDEGAEMRYSTDGETFGTAVTGETAKFFGIRGVTSAEPVMWKIRGNGRISSSQVGINTWSSEDPVTPGGSTVTAMVTANERLWIFYAGGYRGFDGLDLDAMIEVSFLTDTRNGTGATVAPNGLVYFNLLNKLVALDPRTYTTQTVWEANHPELNGTIGAIAASTDALFFTLNTVAGDLYIMKGSLLGPFHTWAYVAGQQGNALAVAGAAQVHEENPALLLGRTDAGSFPYTFPLEFGDTVWYVLEREGYRPEDDENYRFETGTGQLWGSWLDKGALTFPAWLNGGRVITESTVGSRRVTLSYDLDGDEANTTELVVAAHSGLTLEPTLDDSDVIFTRIRHVLSLEVSDDTHSPRCVGVAFDVTPNPPRFRLWQVRYKLAPQESQPGGGQLAPGNYHEQLLFLESAVGQRVLYEDYFGHEWIVKCLSVTPSPVEPVAGQDKKNVRGTVAVVFVEIRATGSDGAIWTWEQSYWNSGDIWLEDE